jgi:GTP cyclohydrolase II
VEANHRLGYAADLRDLAIGAAVLGGLGVRWVRLMTNNPHKMQALEGLRVRCGACATLSRLEPSQAARLGRQFRQVRAPHRIYRRGDWTLSW